MTRLGIYAVGRLRAGPEREFIDDYLERAEKTGRSVGFGPVRVLEVEDKRRPGQAGEAELLRGAIADRAVRIVLDERGKQLGSPEFAQMIAGFRDDGAGEIAFVIGGADGVDPALRDAADMVLSLSTMVWPHMLARVMLAEQIYRAMTILTGGPYHRN